MLYYYAFLNLVKAALAISGTRLPANAKHGISDPRANSRTRLRFAGQRIHIPNRAHDRSEIFPEFLHLLGYRGKLPRSVEVLDLLRFIPNVHRTFTTVEDCPNTLVPVAAFRLMRHDDHVWVQMHLAHGDRDVREAIRTLRRRSEFRRLFHPVESNSEGELWFETGPRPGRNRGVDTAIAQLAQQTRAVGIAALLTIHQGFRWYFVDAPRQAQVPHLAAAYAAMYYLGSITRYKPDVFHKIIEGRHSWIIDEFLATEPMQFLHCLASVLAGVDVVQPYAVIH